MLLSALCPPMEPAHLAKWFGGLLTSAYLLFGLTLVLPDENGTLISAPGALIPEGYSKSSVQRGMPWKCPIRNCRLFFSELIEMGAHFVSSFSTICLCIALAAYAYIEILNRLWLIVTASYVTSATEVSQSLESITHLHLIINRSSYP